MYQCEATATAGMQDVMSMCGSFDANKSTKGASKLRRDLINGEIANLRDLLPLPSSTRQRLSQLQLMALVCVYVRKANYFQQVFKRFHELGHPYCTPNIGFSKALSGFLIMMTQNGKLLYISDNAAEYLGHSMEDLLIHGDSVYDIIDKSDHGTVQSELLRSTNMQNPPGEETRVFLCRMNVSRNARRQMRFGDQKVVLLQGHYLSFLPLCSRNEPVFVATCTPVAMPETRECVVQGATNIFTTIHAMDMKFMHIDRNAEYYLGYTRSEIGGTSWYRLIHWSYMREAQNKHRLISQSEQEKSCILLLRLQKRNGDWIWVHCVLQVKDSSDSNSSSSSAAAAAAAAAATGNTSGNPTQQSVIVATNQILSEREAAVMRVNAWLYHYYTVQTKLQYGLAYQDASGAPGSTLSPSAATRYAAAAAYFPSTQLLSYGTHLHHHQTHQYANSGVNGTTLSHHQTSPESNSIGSTGVSSGYGTSTIQSPHSVPSSYPSSGHYHSYHSHAHAYDMNNGSLASGGTKESPLDFSLGTSAMFEFPMGSSGYPGSSAASSYWAAAHQHSHYGYSMDTTASANNRMSNHLTTGAEESSSVQKHSTTIWPIPSSMTSPPSSSSSSGLNNALQKHSRKNGTSKAKYSSLYPPEPDPASPRTSGSKSKSSNNPNETNPKKKKKHSKTAHHSNDLSVGEISAHENNSSRSSGSSMNRTTSSTRYISDSNNNNPCTSATSQTRGGTLVSMVSPYSYHNHSRRTLHKMFAGSGEQDEADGGTGTENCAVSSKSSARSHSHSHLAVKEESIALAAWPLTPSPIWEGQSHRVPDLQQYYGDLRESHHHCNSLHHTHNGLMMSSPSGGNSTGSYAVTAGLDHSIVPSATSSAVAAAAAAAYHHQQNPIVNTAYLHQFYNGSATSAMMMMTPGIGTHPSSASSAGLLTFGVGGSSGSSTTSGVHSGSLSIESGSPNKENRLPPTPESDPGEHEENRPSLKWESL